MKTKSRQSPRLTRPSGRLGQGRDDKLFKGMNILEDSFSILSFLYY